MTLKIVGGQFKGRMIKTSKSDRTRPTTSLVRAAVFNICQSWTPGSRFLDLFAGSGAMGIEALSRGAAFATFVEKDRQALHCIRENCAQLGLEEKVQILGLDAATAVSRLLAPYDLIYLDPPYGQDAAFLLASIGEKQLLAPHGLLFLEERYQTQKPPPAPPQFERVESRKYGIVHLHQYRRQVAIDEIRHPGTPS